ncbi:MAG: T9SS type A sorting domain-containing protein [Bacteroidota bacterium]
MKNTFTFLLAMLTGLGFTYAINVEDFSRETPQTKRFAHAGVGFGLTGDLDIYGGQNIGFNGDNRWLGTGIENGPTTPEAGGIEVQTVGAGFEIYEFYLFTSRDDGLSQDAGQIIVTGTTFDGKTITQTFETTLSGSTEQGYERIQMGATWLGRILVSMSFTLTGNLNYMRIDDVNMKTYISYPVVWGDISARFDAQRNGVHFTWETLREENVWGFQVQRRRTGEAWTDLGWLDGAGNSQVAQYYEYLDATAGPGVNQYRLKQIDIDGSTYYSVTIESLVGTDALGTLNWQDTHDMLICSHNIVEGDVSLRLCNLYGKELFVQKIDKGTHAFPFGHLPGGVYIAQLEINDWVRTYRFVQK